MNAKYYEVQTPKNHSADLLFQTQYQNLEVQFLKLEYPLAYFQATVQKLFCVDYPPTENIGDIVNFQPL